MGVTLHWISRSTLERNQAALACKRVRGRHTFNIIDAELEQIYSSYGLLNKVVETVTDNASNFIKAFITHHLFISESDKQEATANDQDVTLTDLTEDLSTENDNDGQLTLLPHYTCASHTVSLISTNDFEKHLTSSADMGLWIGVA